MSFDRQNFSFYNEVLDQGHLWQDGWYLYSQGEVTGPFLAHDVFGPEGKKLDKSLASVSRRGLSRWYDLKMMQEVFSSGQSKQTKNNHRGGRSDLAVRKKNISRPKRSMQKSKDPERQALQLIKPVLTPEEATQRSNSVNTVQERVKPPSQKRNPSRKEIEYHHLTLRGRLRLGSFQNPFYQAFVKFLYSFGYSWKIWFEQATIECSYHVDDPQGLERLKNLWHVFVPGLHLVKVYRLARLVLQMEIQNHYKRTSPTLAFLFGIFPPFAIFYLQKAMNAHWALHVCHARVAEQNLDGL